LTATIRYYVETHRAQIGLLCANGVGAMQCRDLSGESVEVDVETFFNGYNVFVLLTPHRRVSLGRRLFVDAPKSKLEVSC
jgi:hypothetical protein